MNRRLGILLVVASAAGLALVPAASSVGVERTTVLPKPSNDTPEWISNSTAELCRLTGPGAATIHGQLATAVGYGLIMGDHGYSFTYDGKLVFLFGDAKATAYFPIASKATAAVNSGRWSTDARQGDARSYTNDAIATASATRPPSSKCPTLTLATQNASTGGAVGAYVNEHVVISGVGGPGKEVSLRGNESPVSGITENGVMYVLFKTNNPNQCPQAQPGSKPPGCLDPKGPAGASYSSVIARLDQGNGVPPDTFQYLYTLSGPPAVPAPATLSLDPCPTPGRFVNVAMANGNDGYVYLWGTSGGLAPGEDGNKCSSAEYQDHSDVYLARIPQSQLGAAGQSGGDAPPTAIQYLTGVRGSGVPAWTSAGSAEDNESAASALFTNGTTPCMAELGVQWNASLKRWMMLYNCKDSTPQNPAGIWMRTAPEPWGPWSAPQTILNPAPGTHLGFCWLIHQQSGCPRGAPNPPQSGKSGAGGAYYGPYFVDGWTTSAEQTTGDPETGEVHYVDSTFYYTLDTYDPYGQWIMHSTVQEPTGYTPPTHHTCTGTKCV